MVSTAKVNCGKSSSFPERAECTLSCQFSDIVNFLLNINGGRDRRCNFAVFVIWSASYTSAKTLESKESISSSSFYG